MSDGVTRKILWQSEDWGPVIFQQECSGKPRW